jgi:hypothetical protein
MPREAFLRKRYAPVRSLNRATAKGHTAAAEMIVSENLGFDLIRGEPPLFVLSICRFVRRAHPSSIRFANRTRPCARGRGKC